MKIMNFFFENRIANACQHYFRDVKRNVVETMKKYESVEKNDNVNDILMLFLQCKMKDFEMMNFIIVWIMKCDENKKNECDVKMILIFFVVDWRKK